MDLFQTYPGGMTNVNTADLYRMQYSTFFGLERIMAFLCRASYSGQYVLTGGNVTVGVSNNKMRVNIPKGYYIIGSKLCCLKSNTYSDYVDMTQTNTIYEYNASDGLVSKTESGYSDYFVNLTQANTYDPLGDKTFANGTVRQTWLVQGFTISITSTQSTYYFCRLRINHSNNTVTLVEAPKNIYDVLAYRYGDTARESQLLDFADGDHNSRMRMLTQHDYYLMNGGFINGVAQLGVGDLTINTTTRTGKSIYNVETKYYDTTITANTLLNASIVYPDSALFRPTAADLSQIIIDKVEFISHDGSNNILKSMSWDAQTNEVNYLTGVPSSVKIMWNDYYMLTDIAPRILGNTTLFPDVNTHGAIDDGKSDKWQNFTYNFTEDIGGDKYATSNLVIDNDYKRAPRPTTDFDMLQVSYRFRVK